ncbi:MAG: glycosyltransferase [Chloroflexi bacterium]|nr:glycosyltransferase [Chloroflexota bacterium]
MSKILVTIYWLSVAALSVYGILGLYTFGQYWRRRHDTFPSPPLPPDPPPVTIQLPIYNEQFVIERLIQAAVAQDYPRHRLQIQIVDDSTDATTTKAQHLAAHHNKRNGVDISLVHRQQRTGYKAGALANALPSARGEYIVIFDADFQPQPDFLQQTIPHFLADGRLGMIQTRWGHLNDSESALTAAQAIALDKHFVMEQTVRHRANLFPKFNGAGGVWRRACLETSGGWQDDTVCEDLCLSTRALLKGWQFRFLNDVVAPAEIPISMAAYKNQQARWAKGSFQCLRKYIWPILSTHEQTISARLYAILTMSAYATHILVILLLLLQPLLIWLDYQVPAWIWLFTLASLGQPLLFIFGQQVLYQDWVRRLRHFPTLMLIAIGLAPTNSRAIFQAGVGRHHPFIRTPKNVPFSHHPGYTLPYDSILLVELFLALYALLGIFIAIKRHNLGPIFFLVVCASGLGYVALLTLREHIDGRHTPFTPPTSAD